MYSNLFNLISNYVYLEKQDMSMLQSLFQHSKVAKGSSIIEIGKHADYVHFINSGYLRYFKTLSSGEELTIHLYPPNEFATSINSFFTGCKSEEALQTITDCELLSITKNNLDKLYASNHKWSDFGRKLMENFLIEKELRIIEQLSLTAKEKYNKLINSAPEIIQNVPVKYIASFIGIQPESLSRIKRQIY